MRIFYNKLVRDKVPEAIASDGHACSIEVLTPGEYLNELKRKLLEEAQEALEAQSQSDLAVELADLLEVIVSLSASNGISFESLETLRLERREQRGGFEERLMLRYVDRLE